MMFDVNFRLAIASLRSTKVRSFMTMFAVIIGVAAFVTVTTTVEGFKSTVQSEVNELGGNLITVLPGDAEQTDESGETSVNFLAFGSASTLSEKDFNDIKKLEGTKAAAPQSLAITNATVSRANGENMKGAIINGTNEDFLVAMNQKLDQGEFLEDSEKNEKKVVIGSKVVDDLFFGDVTLGSKVSIKGEDFTIIGTMEESDSALDFGLVDQNALVFMSIANAKKLTGGASAIDEIDIQVADDYDTEKYVESVEALLLKNHGGEKDFTVLTQEQLLDLMGSLFDQVKVLGWAVSWIMLFVAAVVIMLIMTIAVSERQKEIGIRKSIGANNSHIMIQFLIEAIVISWLGTGLGILVGVGVGFIVKAAAGITPAYTIGSLVLVAFISTLIGTIAGIVPAWQAAKKDPVEALRHE